MHVHVDTGSGRSELRELADLQRLHVEVVGGGSDDDVARALAPFGHLEGDHAWLRAEALRSAGPQDPGWLERFEAMVNYARSQGWTDESGSIRAHLERPQQGT